ncbi:VOC family protein [Pseudonocardia sp. H11422]|uniref:VOC family protein n=1 Tax=Pseudonocardia sp. H11422 TaxID=2835866 RepID=UPI001BDC680E
MTPLEVRARVHVRRGVSFQINCGTQDEVDHYWERLSEDGEEGPCGPAQGQVRPAVAGRT